MFCDLSQRQIDWVFMSNHFKWNFYNWYKPFSFRWSEKSDFLEFLPSLLHPGVSWRKSWKSSFQESSYDSIRTKSVSVFLSSHHSCPQDITNVSWMTMLTIAHENPMIFDNESLLLALASLNFFGQLSNILLSIQWKFLHICSQKPYSVKINFPWTNVL